MKLYCDISKVEPQDDGTLKVWGYASSGAVDSDGEVVSPDAMKQAIPDYMKFGAVREMHQPLAAGTAIEANVEDDGKTAFGAHIVDPVAVKKVTASVYKGFSIGGKVTKRDEKNSKLITGLKLIEVSLVDRPANPEAVFTMYKSETIEESPPAAVEPPVDLEKAAVAEIASLLNKGEIKPTEIVAAIEKSKEPPPAPREKIVPATVQKGMGGLSQFAQLLQAVGWLAQDSAMEAEWEGDGSPLPVQLRDWLATGIQIFENMVTEETGELMAALKPAAEVVVEQITSAATVETAKAGAKFSADSKSKLGDIHKTLLACCDKMDALGYKQDDDAAMAEAVVQDKLAAATIEPPAPIEKTAGDAFLEQLTSVAQATDTLKGELAKRDQVIEALQKRLTALEAQPMPTPMSLRAVNKSEDIGSIDAIAKGATIEIPANATPEDIAKAQIIHQFRTGGRVVG